MMRRREFFKTSVGAGIAAGAALSLGGFGKLWASEPGNAKYDMIALMGGSP
ncbi:MAG: tat (twin-arginine translocation) pathway signal sequence, partial [Bacteroidia bacterium]